MDQDLKSADHFFDAASCDRCGRTLEARIMSWFTSDVLCMGCWASERELRISLGNAGVEVSALEGCGYLPEVPGFGVKFRLNRKTQKLMIEEER